MDKASIGERGRRPRSRLNNLPHMGAGESVERFFQFSLLGLLMSAYLALAGSTWLDRAALDRPTLVLICAGLLWRAAILAGTVGQVPPAFVAVATYGYVAFFPVDYFFLSRGMFAATVHGVCFLATLKILTARTNRDYAWIGVISFIELIWASMLSAHSSLILYLALYVMFAVATFTSAEVRRGFERNRTHVAPAWRARMNWRLALVAATATGGILVITAALFLMVPRTARMAAMFFPNGPRLTGFANEVDLGGFGKISRDDRPVLHVFSYARPLPVGLKWRGAALSRFDGTKWSEPMQPGRRIPIVRGYAEIAGLEQRLRRDGSRMIYRVDVENSGSGTLFIAGIPEFVNAAGRSLLETPEGALHILAAGPGGDAFRYEVSAHSGPELPTALTPVERSRYLSLPAIDARIYGLARQWAGEGEPGERAWRIQDHLQHDFRYSLDGPEQPAGDPLADFLFVRREGYCEYFASAMAVMLRAEGIPARVATGFQSGYFNDVSGLYVVRASDAHAWVEGWIDGAWRTFDPTPSAAAPAGRGLLSRLNMYLDAADHAWQEWVVAYDLTHQAAIAARVEAALRGWNGPQRSDGSGWNGKATWWSAAAVGLLVAGIVFGPRLLRGLRRRVRLQRIIRAGGALSDASSDASLLYQRMLDGLARRGFQKPPWFTPAEFARHLPVEEKRGVVAITEVYNSIRFGGDGALTPQLARLLQDFERAR